VSNKSFTLIEILTVILIVGILSGVIIVATNNVIDSTQDAKRKKDLDSISKALMEYGVMTGSYPVEASECNIGDGTCLDELIDSGYAKGFPLDPSGDRYKYTSDGTTYTIKATLSSNQTLAYSPDTGYSQYAGLVGYTKRKSITINSSASLTDYQVKIDVTYDSDMQADFDDLRFTLSNGTTELSHWLESKTDSVSAVFWVKVPSLSIGDNTIYAYYGNASASSGSDGDNTFEFFDGFEGSSLDTSKWNRNTWGTCTITISNSVCSLYSATGNSHYQNIRSKTTFSRPAIIESRYKESSSRYYGNIGFETSNTSSYIFEGNYTGHNIAGGYSSSGSLHTQVAYTTFAAESASTYYRGTLKMGESSQEFLRNDSSMATRSDATPSGSYYLRIAEVSPYNAAYQLDVDWISVRKYSATEPSVSSWGSEESF